MKTRIAAWIAVALLLGLFAHASRAEEEKAEKEPEKYLLRYQFKLGETLRWEVVHRVKIRSTVSGTTQTAETTSRSEKVWRVGDVRDNNQITLTHSVAYVDMLQQVSGRQDVRYNSREDKDPPPGFETVAKSVGVPLTVVIMDSCGKVIKRKDRDPKQGNSIQSQMTIPLPEEEVAIGDSWKVPHTLNLPLRDGTKRNIMMQQKYTLESVENGLATISVQTQVLTPVHNPEIEVQLVQQKMHGTVKFDLDAGRIVDQRLETNEKVVGFQQEASSMQYASRFEEDFLTDQVKTAAKPQVAGPQPAKE